MCLLRPNHRVKTARLHVVLVLALAIVVPSLAPPVYADDSLLEPARDTVPTAPHHTTLILVTEIIFDLLETLITIKGDPVAWSGPICIFVSAQDPTGQTGPACGLLRDSDADLIQDAVENALCAVEDSENPEDGSCNAGNYAIYDYDMDRDWIPDAVEEGLCPTLNQTSPGTCHGHDLLVPTTPLGDHTQQALFCIDARDLGGLIGSLYHDADCDGFSSEEEILAACDPLDADSRPDAGEPCLAPP